MFGNGTIAGWIAPVLPLLLSEKSPLTSGPLTTVQLSWIGSIPSISAIIGSFFFGYLTSILGCKRTMILIAFPSILFWFLVYFGNTYYTLFIARFAMGLSMGGIQTIAILYVSEIANNE